MDYDQEYFEKYDLRQYHWMKRALDAYKGGKTDLENLVSHLNFFPNALHNASDEWYETFHGYVNDLDIVIGAAYAEELPFERLDPHLLQIAAEAVAELTVMVDAALEAEVKRLEELDIFE